MPLSLFEPMYGTSSQSWDFPPPWVHQELWQHRLGHIRKCGSIIWVSVTFATVLVTGQNAQERRKGSFWLVILAEKVGHSDSLTVGACGRAQDKRVRNCVLPRAILSHLTPDMSYILMFYSFPR